jgi:hypothetical protein
MTRTTHYSIRHRDMQWKEPCRVATTANVTIASGLNAGDTVDGVVLAAGDRVLVQAQSTGSQNGIYIAGATPARAEDMDTSTEVLGAVVYIIAGTANGGKIYVCANTAAVTLGTTALTFAQYAPGGGGGSMTVEQTGGSPSTASVDTIQVGNYTDAGGGLVILFPQITGTGDGQLIFGSGFTDLADDTYTAAVSVQTGTLYVYCEHTPGDLANEGVTIQTGTDYLTLYISERANHALQLHSSDSDVELADQGSRVWKHVTVDGDASVPSYGRLRVLSSAPSSPTEGDSYYDDVLHKTRTYDGTTWQNHW